MRKKLFALIVCLIPYVSNAYKVSYSYDAAGNRVSKEIVLEQKRSLKKGNSHENTVSETLSDKEIRIYPNPTKGILKLEISVLEENDNCEISIYSSSGQLLYTLRTNEQITDIDMTSFTSGAYFLHITINREQSIWKIIKE